MDLSSSEEEKDASSAMREHDPRHQHPAGYETVLSESDIEEEDET